MTHKMTLDIPTLDGVAMQSLALYLASEAKEGRPTGGPLLPLLQNMRVGARGASVALPDSVQELEHLRLAVRMLRVSLGDRLQRERKFRDRMSYTTVVERQLDRAIVEAKKSPLQRLADAAG